MTRDASRGLTLAPFNALSDPRLVADLAARAEERGWHGVFLRDHVVYSPPARAVGDPSDPKELARLLDDALEKLPSWWAGELEPPPLQQPRIPIWPAERYPNRRPLRRAANWDGYFVIDLPGPEALAELAAGLPGPPFELVTHVQPGDDPAPWVAAGATWSLTTLGPDPDPDAIREAIDAGP